MDFTLKTYKRLLTTLQQQGFSFQPLAEFLQAPGKKSIILRHDVDLLPQNSLRFAQIQNESDIKGSYYFRIVPESYDPKIIEEIAKLGHEIGYHYEDVDLASQSIKAQDTRHKTEIDIAEKGIELFEKHLAELRKYYPVKTICMHGSPLSKYDNKLLWKHYNYRDYGIIGEPYFDVDFSKVLYLTDTGRRWDGWKVSLRDKVPQQEQWKEQGLVFHSTKDIIKRFERQGDEGTRKQEDMETRRHGDKGKDTATVKFPDKVMFTFHPQRWHSSCYLWLKEFIFQNAKNQVKRFLVK